MEGSQTWPRPLVDPEDPQWLADLVRIGQLELPPVSRPAYTRVTLPVCQKFQQKLPQLNGATSCWDIAGEHIEEGLEREQKGDGSSSAVTDPCNSSLAPLPGSGLCCCPDAFGSFCEVVVKRRTCLPGPLVPEQCPGLR